MNDVLTAVPAEGSRTAELETEVQRLSETVAQERNAKWNALRNLEQFKTEVRDTAINFQEENSSNICLDGLNQFLDELGLPPKERKYKVTLEIRVRHEVEVTADSEDEASDQAVNDFSISDFYSYDSDVSDIEVYETEEVDG